MTDREQPEGRRGSGQEAPSLMVRDRSLVQKLESHRLGSESSVVAKRQVWGPRRFQEKKSLVEVELLLTCFMTSVNRI